MGLRKFWSHILVLSTPMGLKEFRSHYPSTVDFENGFPVEHSRLVSRPVPETTLFRIWIWY
jgi:hypothetical protein